VDLGFWVAGINDAITQLAWIGIGGVIVFLIFWGLFRIVDGT